MENEDLRNELKKKQELLTQAAKALESVEASQRKQQQSSEKTIESFKNEIKLYQVRGIHLLY